MMQSPHRLSIDRIEQAAKIIDPVFLDSPQYVCEPLSEQLGAQLTLKVETLNPIRSFKGRGADFLVAQAKNSDALSPLGSKQRPTEGHRLVCASHAGLVVESSGAVGVAAIMTQPEMFQGQRVGTIVCGSNLTVTQMQDWLS
jgi:threonine dehydratase